MKKSDLTAFCLGGLYSLGEGWRIQHPFSSFFITTDRSAFLFGFLTYGILSWLVVLIFRKFFSIVVNRFSALSNVIVAFGSVGFLFSILYALIPTYVFLHTGASNGKPNILLITLDTTRADHLGCYGYAGKTSPFLDSIAAKGVLFRQAYTSATWTLPAHTSLFTGKMPSVHGVGYKNFFLSPSLRTLAEDLKAQGYSTAGFIGGPFLVSAFHIQRGFDYYDEQLDPHSKLKRYFVFRVLAGLLKRNLWETNGQRRADEMNAAVFPYLDWAQRHQPYFLFINYFDPHEPYDPPEKYRDKSITIKGNTHFYPLDINTGIARHQDGSPVSQEEFRQLRSLYDGEIRFMDDQISILWQRLETMGLLKNTLVIFVGDHGETIGERGLMDHGHNLYQEQLHIPMIFYEAGSWNGAKTINLPVQITDIRPTILEQLQIPRPNDMQGRSLASLLTSTSANERTILAELDIDPHPRFTPFRREQKMILEKENKYIGSSNGKKELYDLTSDPEELQNLIAGKPELGFDLNEKMEFYFNALQKMKNVPQQKLDDETREKLKSLGYTD
ncbi:MAG: hypothetical protein C5B54_07890 [Acidobacteria bacterium]|nr:MAG: hypothetical protein C5B54_07890 [Acidobacteriota bacterium]